jgi:hypothetical protein
MPHSTHQFVTVQEDVLNHAERAARIAQGSSRIPALMAEYEALQRLHTAVSLDAGLVTERALDLTRRAEVTMRRIVALVSEVATQDAHVARVNPAPVIDAATAGLERGPFFDFDLTCDEVGRDGMTAMRSRIDRAIRRAVFFNRL